MADKQCNKPHAIMISFPFQGHINPFVNLAIKLASKGFTITFVHLEHIHQTLYTAHNNNISGTHDHEIDFFSDAREKSGLDISYATINDGFPLEFDRVLHLDEYWESMMRDFSVLVDGFVGNMVESDPFSTHFLIADTLYTWPATVAKKYNLVNVSFWTEPALVFSITYHLDLLQENGHFPCKDNVDEEINYLPGAESISTRDLMPYLKESEKTHIAHKITVKAFELVKKADFILYNMVEELEFETLSALNLKQPSYAIGPINFSRSPISITKSLWPESDCTKWLDTKPHGSVLYVSFGSLVQTSKHIIEEIAYGLLLSEVNFIWVVRKDTVNSVDATVLPDGFEEEIKDKGLIVTWCDQITVLTNPVVGGFLTHCGWNSILESIWCEVPMICYPLSYDQPTNRKLVVDDWKIGVNLCDGIAIHREEVAEKIRNLMSGIVSNGLKQEIEKVSGILKNAVEKDGSSERNLDRFIEDLKTKINTRNTRNEHVSATDATE